jgi:hypothetical protein
MHCHQCGLNEPCDDIAEALRQAWEIGADHRKPDFDTLNKWAALLSKTNQT